MKFLKYRISDSAGKDDWDYWFLTYREDRNNEYGLLSLFTGLRRR